MAAAIRQLRPGDWPAVAAIYAQGIEARIATFETELPDWQTWDASHLRDHRFVAELEGEVVGWVALAPYSRRAPYRGVADVSVYVAEEARGQGAGRALLGAVVESAGSGGLWTLQAGVFPENEPSLALHRGAGFREVGVRKRIGRLDGVWRNVILLELRL